jgi:tripartite-type tricarboxylate transporter receptor subunit TctC
MPKGAVGFLVACVVACAVAEPVAAQSVADFYKGKIIKFVLSTGEGGGYDTYARAIEPYMEAYLPGNPKIIIQHMQGAGGLVAANNLYNVAPRDGTQFAMIHRAAVSTAVLFGKSNVRSDPTKFGWIGSMNDEKSICAAWHTAPVKSFADLQKTELVVSALGRGTDTDAYSNLLKNLFGAKLKIVTGYDSGSAMELALERGEVGGRCAWSWSTIMSTKAEWVRDKKIVPLVQMSLSKHPDLPDVPLITEFITSDEQRQILEVVLAPQIIGRPLLMPPEVPAERLTAFRAAFNASMQDPKFIAEAKARNMEISAVTGEQIDEMIDHLFKTPKPIVEKAVQALENR